MRERRPRVSISEPRNSVHLHQGVTEALDPVGLVHPDQAHAPCQGLAPAACHATRDEGVEDRALAHSQPGHDREAERGEDLLLVAAPRPPRHLALELALCLAGDPDPLVPGLLAETLDPGGSGRSPTVPGRAAGELDVGQGAQDEDLLSVRRHVRGPDEPTFGNTGGEPGADVLGHCDYKITARGPALYRT